MPVARRSWKVIDFRVLSLMNGSVRSIPARSMCFRNFAARPLPAYIPSRGATVAASVGVRVGEAGDRVVELTLGPLQVTVAVSAAGDVTHASIPAQSLDARLASASLQGVIARAAPEGINEELFEVTRDGVALRGSLWRSTAATGPVPVVVLTAGSGPTDRDCNSARGLRTDAHRLLAEGPARHGVASGRFDQRGVGASGTNFDAATTTLTDFVDDAAALLAQVRVDHGFGAVTLAGHSDGGLSAMTVASHARVDGLVLLATPGRTFHALIREQMARPLDALGAPGVKMFLHSILEVDPARVLRGLTVPKAVVQGETDLQVTVADTRLLAGAPRDPPHAAARDQPSAEVRSHRDATAAELQRPLAAARRGRRRGGARGHRGRAPAGRARPAMGRVSSQPKRRWRRVHAGCWSRGPTARG
jgi:pimeloyl-ACP methyl ester carboxylesterase